MDFLRSWWKLYGAFVLFFWVMTGVLFVSKGDSEKVDFYLQEAITHSVGFGFVTFIAIVAIGANAWLKK